MLVRYTLEGPEEPSHLGETRKVHPICVVLRKKRRRWLLVHISFPAHPGISPRLMCDFYQRDSKFGCRCGTIADDLLEPWDNDLVYLEARAGRYPPELREWLAASRAIHKRRRTRGKVKVKRVR